MLAIGKIVPRLHTGQIIELSVEQVPEWISTACIK